MHERDHIQSRHNVQVLGDGDLTLLLVHGLGCNQRMWEHVIPQLLHAGFRLVLMDLAGFGKSDRTAWDLQSHGDLRGHAQDVATVARVFGDGRTMMVGHSVAAMLGLMADLAAPDLFIAHAMVCPSPCYKNDGCYEGGFEPHVLEGIVRTIEADAQAAAEALSAAILGSSPTSHALDELVASFCAASPQALAHLSRATFMGDHRDLLPGLRKPVLMLQCTGDQIAPPAVGRYMQDMLTDCTLVELACDGHSPHVTDPGLCATPITSFARAFGSARQHSGDVAEAIRASIPTVA